MGRSEISEKKLLKMFDIYDVNNDGVIDFSDFELVAANFVQIYDLPVGADHLLLEKFNVHWKGLLASADYDKDRKITLQEWIQYWTSIKGTKEGETMVTDLMNAFLEIMDLNNTGYVDLAGYQNFVKAFQGGKYDLNESLKIMDLNQDSKVTRDEAIQIAQEFFFSDDPDSRANLLFGPLDD